MHFLRFPQINTKENAAVGCLIYPSLALHNKKVKGNAKTKKTIQWEKFISNPHLMPKKCFQENINIFSSFQLYARAYVRMYV